MGGASSDDFDFFKAEGKRQKDKDFGFNRKMTEAVGENSEHESGDYNWRDFGSRRKLAEDGAQGGSSKGGLRNSEGLILRRHNEKKQEKLKEKLKKEKRKTKKKEK